MSETTTTKKKRKSREDIAEKIEEFEQAYSHNPNQRQLAEELSIPRSTLQYWLKRKENIAADPEIVAFFESPTGVAFLHRLVLAAHFVITLLCPSGIRLVCLFLELTGLNQFVAASYGTQREVTVAMEKVVVEFGQEEQQRLAAGMKTKQITVCEDETFHPAVCLVAIEPVSNFILLEQYTDNRQAQTWTRSLEEATEGLPIEIVQSTSDEGTGILHHVEVDLGAQHSPDVFHVQHELVKGTSGALASKKRKAVKAVEEATKQVNRQKAVQETYRQAEDIAVCPPELAEQLEQAQEQEQVARQVLETATAQQEQAQQAIRSVSAVYHPYDLETGAAQNAAEVATALEEHFTEIEQVATAAQLSESSFKKIAKAKRVVSKMVATLAFFWLTVRAKVSALALTSEVEQAVYDYLIPATYLHLVAEKSPDAEHRHALQKRAEALLVPLRARDGPLGRLEPEEKALIEQVSQECAQLFQRSSSCVEGRNGQLALHHHSLHRIGNRKLAALTTIHNYFIKRSDGTTASERFFGASPRNLFEQILDRVDLPGRPAQKRPRPQRKPYLAPVAA